MPELKEISRNRIIEIALGLFLSYWFLATLVSEIDLFSNQGAIGYGRSLMFPTFFPEGWIRFLSPRLVTFILATGLLGSMVLVIGLAPITSCLTVWLILVLLTQRNPYVYTVGSPFVGSLLWILPLTRMEKRLGPSGSPRSPAWIVAWTIVALGYLASGISKLRFPHWASGEALELLAPYPLMSGLYYLLGASVLKALTYAVIAAELSILPLAAFRRTRSLAWVVAASLQMGIFLLMNISTATIPILIFHIYLLDPGWTRSKLKKRVT